jgi:hypothetical protein
MSAPFVHYKNKKHLQLLTSFDDFNANEVKIGAI